MPKLWIVHRHPPARAALARLSGLSPSQVVLGAPRAEDFRDDAVLGEAEDAKPSAILMDLSGDAEAASPPLSETRAANFERELDFAHRILSGDPAGAAAGGPRTRPNAAHARLPWVLIARPGETGEVARLFELLAPVVLEAPVSPRALRQALADAIAQGTHRRTASLAERGARRRLADRFSAWFGDLEVAGLMRALDPALGALPLLVRGVPGSGRALVARYVELFRTPSPGADLARRENSAAPAPLATRYRLHAHDVAPGLAGPASLAERLHAAGGARSLWIDEVDALSPSAQRALADWIVGEEPPGGLPGRAPHWVATAGPARWQDSLEPALERAFSPLILDLPSLADDPEAVAPFAEAVALHWSRSVGGSVRRLHPDALAALHEQTWPGDRAELEAVVRSALAATTRPEIQRADLDLGPVFGAAGGSEAGAADPLGAAPSPLGDPERVRSPDEMDFETEAELRAEMDANAALNRIDPLDAIDGLEIVEATSAAEDDEADLPEPETLIQWGRTTERADPVAEGSLFPGAAEPARTSADVPPEGFEFIEPPAAAGADAPIFEAASTPEPSVAAEPENGSDPDESLLLTEASFALASETEENWRRLARSLAHEIRNPLVSIRTFAEMLPENHTDETFRERFVELVGRDVRHIDRVISRMQSVAQHQQGEAEPVDVSALLEELLDARRGQIQTRRLLVLRELERDRPLALAEAEAVRAALAGLLDRAIDSLPERGDLFVATRHIERASEGESRLRILLRFHSPELGGGSSELEEFSPAANVLEYVLAENVARSSGGHFAIDSSDARETLILFDLKTPS